MSKVNTMLKENYDLKNELESMVLRIKENEAKHHGFKIVQFSMLLSDSLEEIDNKPLKYIEDIFDIDKAVLFIRHGSFSFARDYKRLGSRIIMIDNEAIEYTFLDMDIRSGSDKASIHKEFHLMPEDKDYSYVLIPITDDEGAAGALGFYSRDKKRFSSAQNFDFVQEFALIASISLKRLENSYLLEKQANTDYLTGLPNKFVLDTTGQTYFDAFKTKNMPFAFFMIDLNNFKYINDHYGHLEGDRVLRIVAHSLSSVTNVDDTFGRFGGDEFYLFTHRTGREDLENFVKRLKDSVKGFRYDKDDNYCVSFSCGIVLVDDDKYKSFEDIFKLSDERLYDAKSKASKEKALCIESVIVGI